MIIKLRKMMTRKEGQKGFTLVELIVVMAILAVLAALAVPRFSNILTESKKKADVNNVKLLQDAVDLYYGNIGSYPVNLEALKTNYIKEVPKQQHPAADPPNAFGYTNVDDGTHKAGDVWDPNI